MILMLTEQSEMILMLTEQSEMILMLTDQRVSTQHRLPAEGHVWPRLPRLPGTLVFEFSPLYLSSCQALGSRRNAQVQTL
ncbi:unnamed protein product [Merluccius merluccius]